MAPPFPCPMLSARAEPQGDFLPLRASPSSAAPVLAEIRPAETVFVLKSCGCWTLVRFGSVTGYAFSDELTLLYPPGLHYFM